MSAEKRDKNYLAPPAAGNGYAPVPRYETHDPSDTQCGCFCCQPRWMQSLANKFTYLLVYCSCGLVQGMWYTYFVSILTTVEKTFKFPSSVTGIILAGNDVAQIFFAVFISYYGGKGNRPRWVGAGMLCNALGCLLSALPQFVWGPDPQDIAAAMSGTSTNSSQSNSPQLEAGLCHLTPTFDPVLSDTTVSPAASCDQGSTVSMVPVVLLFLSQFVSGVGATAYYTLGLTYLDDSVEKGQSPVMFAISAGLRVMGPMLGFMLGSFSLSRFVIPSLHPSISQKDPRWIGAWWLGFFVLAGLLVVVSSLMCLFPKTLPKRPGSSGPEPEIQEEIKLEQMLGSREELHTGVRPAEQLSNITGLKDMLGRLVKNPLLIVLLINVVFAVTGFIGYFTFMPKYQQAAFKQSAANASLFSGISGVLVTLVGYIGSGVVIKVFKPRSVIVTGYSALVSGIQTVCMFALMAIRCDEVPLHGTQADDGQFLLTAGCNADCGCGTHRSLSPICAQDGRASFFSPCFAGCQDVSVVNGSTLYSNCSCIVELDSGGPVSLNSTHPLGSTVLSHLAGAVSGFCELPCSGFTYYIIILAVMKFIGSTNRTGGMLVFFRSVEDKDKSLAIGMSTALLSIFCFIPAPIIFGAVVDQTCLIWEEKPCGGRGNCLLYDTDKLRVYLHTATVIPFAISFVLDIAVMYLARNIKLYGDDEQKPNEAKKPKNVKANGTNGTATQM